MQNQAHYQHLSNSLNEVHKKFDGLSARVSNLTHKVDHLPATPSSAFVIGAIPTSTASDTGRTIMQALHVEGPASKTIQISPKIIGNTIFVTMVGAGGAGAVNDSGPGAGGGAGKSLHRVPLSLSESTGRVMITAGMGGDAITLHGTASTVEPEMKFGARRCLVAEGGRAPAQASKGGVGATSEIYPLGNGMDGADAEEDIAGAGGSSNFAVGGKGGGTHYVRAEGPPTVCLAGQNGSYGSGGGGSVACAPGCGGHGFVLIEYPVLD